MPDNPNTAEPHKPRRRCFQFSLRTLLITVAIMAMLCPLCVRYVREREHRRADALERAKKIAAAMTFGGSKLHRQN